MKIQIYGLKSKIIQPKEKIFPNLIQSLQDNNISLQDNDIIVITSKVISMEQDRIIDIHSYPITENKRKFVEKIVEETNMDPHYASLILDESDMVIGGVEGAVLTLTDNLLLANAGIDRSNVMEGKAILLPVQMDEFAEKVALEIKKRYSVEVGVLIIDSATIPLRRGTTGLCLAASSLVPAVVDERGKHDLFGHKISITTLAIADNVATAATLAMGETDESKPFALIRGVPLAALSQRKMQTTAMTIPFDQCLYFKHFSGKAMYIKPKENKK